MLARLRALGTTSPGRLAVVAVVLMVVTLVTGVITAARVQSRLSGVQSMVDQSGPLSVHAQELYRALSDADATAASALLEGGLEPRAVRVRYERDIAQATNSLAAAADLAGGAEDSRDSLARISAHLPVYTGLVENARAYNRQGYPLGAAYLREASGVMRGTLLVAARELYEVQTARLAADTDRARANLLPDLLLGVVMLGVLIAAQIYVTRRTNRLVNVGLGMATAAALISVLWTAIALSGSAGNLNAAEGTGSDQVHLLTEARLAALEARGDEGLTLVARGSGAAFEENFVAVSQRLGGADGSGGLLGEALAGAPDDATRTAVTNAIQSTRQWFTAHTELRALDDGGRYDQAVAIAIGPEETSAGSAFVQVDEQLAGAINHTQGNFLREATQARGALNGVPIAVLVLAVVAAAAVAVGLSQRVMEYW